MDFKNINKILIVTGIILTLLIMPTLISFLFSETEIFSSWKRYLNSIYFGLSYGVLFSLGNWGIGVISGTKLNWRKNPNRANLISLLSFIFYGIFASLAVPFILLKFVYHQSGPEFINNVIIDGFIAFSIDMIVISIYYSLYLVHYWKKSIEKSELLERETLMAKYEALKSQVNPHFLFNSLNTLTGVVEHDQKKAVIFIKKLSDIYRYILDQRNKELVEVQDEIKFVEDYIFLSKLRHGAGLNYTLSIISTDKLILPLGLQILVENSINHNIIENERPLNIEITEEGSYLKIKNNIQKKTTVKGKNSGIGLENLKKRYEYLSNLSVEIVESNTHFLVKIPLIENPDK